MPVFDEQLGFPGCSGSPPNAETAYQQLLAVNCFAFGGVGDAGTISEGESAYQAILASPKALSVFEAILTTGTPEGKLYALCGIRRLHPTAFERYAEPLRRVNPVVTTAGGCFEYHEDAAAVIERIAKGWSGSQV